MALCKTSNFSIFTFINASDLKFYTCSYSSCVYHMMRFKWKSLQMMMSHFRTHTLDLLFPMCLDVINYCVRYSQGKYIYSAILDPQQNHREKTVAGVLRHYYTKQFHMQLVLQYCFNTICITYQDSNLSHDDFVVTTIAGSRA